MEKRKEAMEKRKEEEKNKRTTNYRVLWFLVYYVVFISDLL